MAHRQLIPVRSQCLATIAIPSRVSRVYIGSSSLRTSSDSELSVPCRTYTSKLETLPHVLASSQSVKPKPVHTPRPPGASPSFAQTSTSSKRKNATKPIPEVVVYHNPASAASVKLLIHLRDAQRAFPQTTRRTGPPLDFNLKILERLPTAEELQDMYSLHNETTWTIFRARNIASNYRHHPTSARSLLDLLRLEREEEIAKAKQTTHEDPSLTTSSTTDSSLTDSSATELHEEHVSILDIDHPLFGTQTFSWPVTVCWEAQTFIAGLQLKHVYKLLKRFANERDDVVVKSKEQIKEDIDKARQAKWVYPEKAVSPDEEDTLKWFNEKPGKTQSW